jgi:hypothetical protein
MKLALLLPLVLGSAVPAFAEEPPMLAVPGKVLFESKLDSSPAAPWKVSKGTWEAVSGTLRGSEKAEDQHGAVMRLPDKLPDFIIEYEFKFDGAKSTSLSINAPKDHMARILISPQSVTIQKDDNDHAGPDQAVVFARFPAKFPPGTWHKVRMEMVGDTMLGKVDEWVAWGSNDLFKKDRMAPGFTVGGQSVEFRNLTIREATLNPQWESVKAGLPKPGEKVSPPAAKKTAAN